MDMASNISDLISIGNAAFQIYQSLAGAPEDYRNLHLEFLHVSKIHNSLTELCEQSNQPGSRPQLHRLEERICNACHAFRPTWQEVEQVVHKYRGVDARERMRDYARLVLFTLKDLSPYYLKLHQHRETVANIFDQFNAELGLNTNEVVHDTQGVVYSNRRRLSVIHHNIQNGNNSTLKRLEDYNMKVEEFMKVVSEQLQNMIGKTSTNDGNASDAHTVIDDEELEKATVIFGVPVEDAVDAKELMSNVINAVRDFVQQPRIRLALLAEENQTNINALLSDCEAHLVNAGMAAADARAARPLMQDCLRDAAVRAQMSHGISDFVNSSESRQRVLIAEPNSSDMRIIIDTVVRDLVAAKVSVEAAHSLRQAIGIALVSESNETELRVCVREVLSKHPELTNAPMSEADIPRPVIKEIQALAIHHDVSHDHMSALGRRLKTLICFTANEPFLIDTATPVEDLGPDDSISSFERLQLRDSNTTKSHSGPPLTPHKPAALANYRPPQATTVLLTGRRSSGGSQRGGLPPDPVSSPNTSWQGSASSPVTSTSQLKSTPTRSPNHDRLPALPPRVPSGSSSHGRNISNQNANIPVPANMHELQARPQPHHSLSDPTYSHEPQSPLTFHPQQHPVVPQDTAFDPLIASFIPPGSAPYATVPQPANPLPGMRLPHVPAPNVTSPNLLSTIQQPGPSIRRRPVGSGSRGPFASSTNDVNMAGLPQQPRATRLSAEHFSSPTSLQDPLLQPSAPDLFRSTSASDSHPPPLYSTVVGPTPGSIQVPSLNAPIVTGIDAQPAEPSTEEEAWMVRAIKGFQPVGSGFCRFETNDVIQVLNDINADWFFGRSTVTGAEGKMPWDHTEDMENEIDDDLDGLDIPDDIHAPGLDGAGKKILFVDDYNDTRSIAVQACMELILDNLEAEGYFEEASQIAKIESAGVYVDGQGGTQGNGPNETILEVIFKGHRRSNARARDFEERVARQLTLDDFHDFDLIVCLDRSIYEIVHTKLESYQDAGHDLNPRITPLGWYVDGRGKRKWEDIDDPIIRKGLFKSTRSRMEKCWEKVQRCTKNWLLDETGWRGIKLSSLPDGNNSPYYHVG